MPKLTVEFNDKMNDLLAQLAEERGTSKAEILRHAVAVYRYLTKEVAEGERKVLVSDSNQELKNAKEVILP